MWIGPDIIYQVLDFSIRYLIDYSNNLIYRIREKYPELFHIGSYNYGDINFLWANKYEEY